MAYLVYICPGESYGSDTELHKLTKNGRYAIDRIAGFLGYILVGSELGSYVVLLKKGSQIHLETAKIVGRVLESPIYFLDEDGSWLTTDGEVMTYEAAIKKKMNIVVIQNCYQKDESELRSPYIDIAPGTMVVFDPLTKVRYHIASA